MAEEANFTKAAARVHVSQPGVSAQVRQLEREFGQALLDRSGRTVRLTEVGAAVLPYARAALAAVTSARLAVDELTGLLRGRVAIGMVTSHQIDLASLLAGFHRDHQAVEITLTEGNLDDACAAAGFTPHIAFETSAPQLLAQFATQGLGLAILPEAFAKAHPAHLDIAVITNPPLRGRLALAWRAEAPVSPAARVLIDHARAAFAGTSPPR